MSTDNKQDKPLFKLIVTQKNISMKASNPSLKTIKIVVFLALLGIVLFIAFNEPNLRSKALDLMISIIQAVVTFFNAGPKTK